jgi:LysM repeat protein
MSLLPWAGGAAATALAAAVAVLPGAAPAQSGCGTTYTVQAGDTLAAIAERCDTTVDALVGANAVITDPARITVGWDLAIPGAAASLGPDAEVRLRARGKAAEAALTEGAYQVRPGDSFASIATALQVPMRALMAANRGVEPFGLRPGQILRLPSGDAPPADDQEGQAAPDPARDAPGQADAPRPAAEAEAPATDAPEARSEAERDEPTPERLTLEGRVQSGAECPVLETPQGEVYSLVSAEYGFMPGEYVEIEGEPVEQSFCMQGKATVRVTSMNAVPAPLGG